MNILGVIPARYASTRFPGKPLVDIKGRSMIERVYEQASAALSLQWLVVATDDDRIFNHVKDFGGTVVMTEPTHPNGTSRVLEVVEKLEKEPENFKIDAVINIQGDEPFIQPDQIDLLAGMFSDEDADIVTLCKKIETEKELFNPNVVKLVKNRQDFALYFSRSAIPFGRSIPQKNWTQNFNYFKHLGIYGYRTVVLKKIVNLEMSMLENAEKLEQLRWLENGFQIKVAETEFESLAVDTPEDLERILKNF